MMVPSFIVFASLAISLMIKVGIFPSIFHVGLVNLILFSLLPDFVLVLYFTRTIQIAQGSQSMQELAVIIGGILIGLIGSLILYFILGFVVDERFFIPSGVCLIALFLIIFLTRTN